MRTSNTININFAIATLLVLPAALPSPASADLDLGALVGSADAHLARQLDVITSEGPRLPQTWRAYPPLQYDGFTYDAAVQAIYHAKRGRIDLARPIADAFLVLQRDDLVPDGHIHVGYWITDLHDPSGQYTSVKHPDISPGSIAWAGKALTEFYAATGEQKYLNAATSAGDWILSNCRRANGPGGFSAGLVGWGSTPAEYRVTEHNIDIYALARDLYCLTGDSKWSSMAEHAQGFVRAMWDETESRYFTGTDDAGVTINPSPVPADVQAWVHLAGIDDPVRTSQAVEWSLQNLLTQDVVNGISYHGIRFSDQGQHVHCEVTAGTAMALLLAGGGSDANWLLENLDSIRLTAPNHDPDGIGIVATPWPGGAYTGYGSTYYPNALHVGSTAWLGLAALVAQGDIDANPFRTVPEPGSLGLLALGAVGLARSRAARDCRSAREYTVGQDHGTPHQPAGVQQLGGMSANDRSAAP